MSSKRFSLMIAILLALLLATLATLQYRWTGELSRAEKERLQATLHRSVRDFSEDFNREVGRLVFHFLAPGPPGANGPYALIENRFASWKDEPYSGLLRDLYLTADGVALQKLNPDSGRFETCEWPVELKPMRERWNAGEPAWMELFEPTVPAITLPVPLRDWNGVGPGRAQIVFVLDLPFIRNEFLPELVRRHFGGALSSPAAGGSPEPRGSRGWGPRDQQGDDAPATHSGNDRRDYTLAVFAGSNAIYQSDPGVDLALFQAADAEAGLFSLPRGGRPGPPRPDSPESVVGAPRREPNDGGPPPGPPRRRGPGFVERFRFSRPPPGEPTRGLWTVRVTNRAGSLEAAVQRVRTRNLVVSFGILALLGASVVLVVVSSHRARELARRQVEFVAGVSHELRTPLSVIRSAAQNLAEGAVDDRAQVLSYGALIEKEGRRLSEMVDEVLDFATPQSARAQRFAPVAVSEVVDSAVEASDSLLKEGKIQVEKRVPDVLPLVKGDASALSRAFENLIVNAVKYGGDARWVGIKAYEAPGEVLVTVSDRGPGIEEVDLPHLFEPFYRGQSASYGGRRGNGLGLSFVKRIVEAHGGRVTVETELGRGSSFTVHVKTVASEA